VVAPDAGHGVVATAELGGQQPGRPVRDPEVLGWWGEGGGQDLGSPVGADGLGPARARLVAQAVQAGRGVAVPPQDDGRPCAADPMGDLGVGPALGGQQQDLGPLDEGGSGRA